MEIVLFVSAASLRNSQEPMNNMRVNYVTIGVPTERSFPKVACQPKNLFRKIDLEEEKY